MCSILKLEAGYSMHESVTKMTFSETHQNLLIPIGQVIQKTSVVQNPKLLVQDVHKGYNALTAVKITKLLQMLYTETMHGCKMLKSAGLSIAEMQT